MRNVPNGTTSVNQGMLAEIPWKTVAEIRNSLGYLVKPELFTVKATLSYEQREFVLCSMPVGGEW
jgi:hypothetical protein